MSVVAGSPAADAGLRSGDIILEVDDHPIIDVADLQRLMVGEALGGPMQVRVWRDGGLRTLPVRPIELEAA
jgi:S1-C subfamily serine protease